MYYTELWYSFVHCFSERNDNHLCSTLINIAQPLLYIYIYIIVLNIIVAINIPNSMKNTERAKKAEIYKLPSWLQASNLSLEVRQYTAIVTMG